MSRLMKFQPFNESKAQEDINKMQDDVRSKIEVIANKWKEDIHECLLNLLDNYECKNMKLTWDLTPSYSISGYNRDIVKQILNKCKLKYLMTVIINTSQTDEFIDNFNYVKDFLKSYLDAKIQIYNLSILKNGSIIQSMRGQSLMDFNKIIDQLNKVKDNPNLKLELKMKIY